LVCFFLKKTQFEDVYPLKIFRKIFNMKIFEERNIFDIVSNDSDFIASTNELFSLVLKNYWKWSIDHNCHYSNDKLKCILIMIHAWLCLIREYDFARKHDSYVQYIFVVSLGTKGVSQNHLLSFDDNKVLKIINWIC